MTDNYQKYLKYKKKYLDLKGGLTNDNSNEGQINAMALNDLPIESLYYILENSSCKNIIKLMQTKNNNEFDQLTDKNWLQLIDNIQINIFLDQKIKKCFCSKIDSLNAMH